MPFSFLNPWLWLGALALAAPLWLHLRRKQQTTLFSFSAVRFLADQPLPNRSPLQLRRRLLFAIRALALLLIIAGFAWPYSRRSHLASAHEARVYILDNTLSHQAGNGFGRDRDWLASELGRAAPSVQVAAIELTATPHLVVAFDDQRESARQKIAGLQPSHQRGSYLAAFRQANSLLANSFGRQKKIILLGDEQENQWTENTSAPPFLTDVQLELPRPKTRSLPNLSLSAPRAQRLFAGDKSLVQFSVKLNHLGPARSARLVVRVNGQEIVKRTVNLENQPPTLVLQASWESDPVTWLEGEAAVEGDPDALPADNRVFFALPPVSEGKVALLARSPYLRLALSPDIMRGRWSTQFVDPARPVERPDTDVLCLESGYLQSSEVRKLLHEHLAQGRGVLLIVNRLSPAIEGCLRELGFEPEGVARPGDERPEAFQFVLSNHPIFHPFLSADYGNLQEIKISEFVRLKSSTATPLAFGQNGTGLLFQSSKSPGKLLALAFGLDREHTSWPIHQTFIPFLDLALQAARVEDPTPITFEPGEVARIPLAGRPTPGTWVLQAGVHEVARARLAQGCVQIRLPDQPGLYTLRPEGEEKVERILCVNPSPKESQLVYTDSPEALPHWRAPRPTGGSSGYSSVTAQLRVAGLLQQRLWWWMLMGGLVALMLEMSFAEVKKEAR